MNVITREELNDLARRPRATRLVELPDMKRSVYVRELYAAEWPLLNDANVSEQSLALAARYMSDAAGDRLVEDNDPFVSTLTIVDLQAVINAGNNVNGLDEASVSEVSGN